MSDTPISPKQEKKTIENPVSLSKIREQLQLSQTELAEVLNIEPHNISKYEKNHSAIPLDVVMDLASRFNLSLDELLMRKPEEVEEGITLDIEWLNPREETKAFFRREMEKYPFFKVWKERFDNTTEKDIEIPLDMARLAEKSHRMYQELHLPLISFTGLFSTGKSTVINTILGDKILPTDTKMTTSLPIFICSDQYKGDYLPEEHDFMVIKTFSEDNRQWYRNVHPSQFEFQTFDKKSWCLSTEKLSELKNYVCYDGFEYQMERPAAVFLFLPAEKFPILHHCYLLDLPGLDLPENTLQNTMELSFDLPKDWLSFLEKSQRVYYCSPSYRFLESSQATVLHAVLLQCTSEKQEFFDKICFLKTFSHIKAEPKGKEVLAFLQQQYGDFCHSERETPWVPLDFAPNNREICQGFYENLSDFLCNYPKKSSDKIKKDLLEYWKENASLLLEKKEKKETLLVGEELFSSLDDLKTSLSYKKSEKMRMKWLNGKETQVASYHKDCLSEMRKVIEAYDSDFFIAYFEKVSATPETLPHALYCLELDLQQQLEEIMGKYDLNLLKEVLNPIEETFTQWKKLDKGNLFHDIFQLDFLFPHYLEALLGNEVFQNPESDLFPYVWNNIETLNPSLNMPLLPKKKPLCSPSFFFSFIEVLADYKMVPHFQSPIAKRLSKRLHDEFIWEKISDVLLLSLNSAYERNESLFLRYDLITLLAIRLVIDVKNSQELEGGEKREEIEINIILRKIQLFLQLFPKKNYKKATVTTKAALDHVTSMRSVREMQSMSSFGVVGGASVATFHFLGMLRTPLARSLGLMGGMSAAMTQEKNLQQTKEEQLKEEKELKKRSLRKSRLLKNESDFISFQKYWSDQKLESFLEERENFQDFALRYGKEQTEKYGLCAVSSVRWAYQQCYPQEEITMEGCLEFFQQLLEKETNTPPFLLRNEILFQENLFELEDKEVFWEKLKQNFAD